MPGTYSHLFSIEALALENRDANNDPYEPFRSVGDLFDADWQTRNPGWASREHWEVVSPFRIAHKPVEEIVRLSLLGSDTE